MKFYIVLYLLAPVVGTFADAAEFDLSADWPESSPVFQASEDQVGAHRYTNFREPVVVKTRSGKLIVGLHAGNRLSWPERSGQDLAIRISSDRGKSWGPVIIAAEHGNYSCQCHGLVYDAEIDRVLFLYTVYNWDYTEVGKGRGQGATAPVYAKMTAEQRPFVTSFEVHSDDEGLTWSKPRDITGMVGRQAHFGASEGRQLTVDGPHKGRLLLAGSRMDLDVTGAVTHKHVGVWHSDDHGKTWTLATIPLDPSIHTPRNASSEARVTELPDGGLLYNERTRNTGRQLATSADGGSTWSQTSRAPELLATQCNGSLLTLRGGDGKLTNTILHSVPTPGGRSDGVIYISRDGGKTWPASKNIIAGNFAYSALIQIDADSVGLFYETGHYQDINLVTLPVSLLVTDP